MMMKMMMISRVSCLNKQINLGDIINDNRMCDVFFTGWHIKY